MEMAERAKIDKQGRVIIPKELREKLDLKGEIEIIETEQGLLIRPLRKSWSKLFSKKVKVDWRRALAVSLENASVDDLLFG